MRILILEHEPDSPAGFLVGWARRRGHSLETLQVPRLQAWPDPSESDVIVSLGSDCSAHASVDPWIEREIAFLRECHHAGMPLLGICFGAQALALALGGTVRRADFVEVGWSSTHSSEPELLPSGPWFAWHEDVFSVPPAAREIARSDAGPLAFVSGLSIGLQFHPEVDSRVIRGWINGARDRIAELSIDEDALLGEVAAGARARAEDLFDRIVRYWKDGPSRSSVPAGPRVGRRDQPAAPAGGSPSGACVAGGGGFSAASGSSRST
ncbi:MAG TPA: type 1 glutamine amidotransferase [Solirubrobacteraceae bacterium]|jgi:GMP synthase-like glutamine amidotransferase|nr:type 1 glutamine amidotransferase [Solirubrobacteraceae bacterium]